LIYTGPVYSTEELDQAICPWCIADGTAAEKFDAEFTDIGWGVPKEVPKEVLMEVSQRTPGFSGWQQEHWLYHHSNAAAFLGPVGASELAKHPDALEMLSHEHDQYRWTPEQVADYLKALHRIIRQPRTSSVALYAGFTWPTRTSTDPTWCGRPADA
jgi:uncharacterized protein CbrC (UPF0167 family)